MAPTPLSDAAGRLRVARSLALFGAVLAVACGGPRAVADWRMADRALDLETDVRTIGDADTPGADGVLDDYDNAQGDLMPGRNGNISTRFPPDGRYEVTLDACGSSDATRFTWSIDGEAPFTSETCEGSARLSEGPHQIELTVADAQGAEGRARVSAEVRDLIVVGLGDSFSAGSGDSRSGLVAADYDNTICTRSGRSGQARAALELERRDPKTSVTFIHLACGGARADFGLLGAHNNQPPQVLELLEILPPGQAVDFLSLTIGGNDVRFSEIVGQLVDEADAPLSLLDGERVHDRVQRQLLDLRERMARVAACFGDGFEGRDCEVVGPSGRDDDATVLRLPRIPIAASSRIVQVTYPDLTTRFQRDEAGNVVRDPNGLPRIETCPSGMVEQPGDLLDGLADGRVNGRVPGVSRAPLISLAEWSWGDAAMLAPRDPAPDDAAPSVYAYTPESGGAAVPLSLLNTLNSVVLESQPRFGWTGSARWWSDSRGHGYCAPETDNWFFRAIFHPNDLGYEGKARALVAEAQALGLVPATR